MNIIKQIIVLALLALPAIAQYPVPGSTGGAGGGGGCTAGTGITCTGSTINVDTAVIQSRATAQAGTSLYCRSTTGNDTYTCSITPTLTAYTTGSCLVLNPDTANTGTATLNVDALGAKSILGPFGSALSNGDVPTAPVQICYNGTAWLLSGNIGGGGVLSTTGAVPYVSAAGVLNQDASNFFWDATNHRLGIGTVSPSVALDVSGSGRFYDQTATTGSTLVTLRSGAGQATSLLKAYDTGNSNVLNLGANGEVETLTGGSTYGTQTTGNKYSVNSTGLLQFSSSSQAYDTKDAGIGRNAAGLVEINNGTLNTYRDLKFRNRVMTVGSNIASAGTIAPTESVHHVTGTTTISTITAPTGFAVSSAGGQIVLIPDGLWATNTAGNIALATTAVVSKALILTYDNATSKWYPSY